MNILVHDYISFGILKLDDELSDVFLTILVRGGGIITMGFFTTYNAIYTLKVSAITYWLLIYVLHRIFKKLIKGLAAWGWNTGLL